MKKVLVIEDDVSIAHLLEIHLNDLSCEVIIITDGKEGMLKSTTEEFDLIVLDLMLPNVNGIEICKEVRKKEIYTPILMLTSKSEELDKVLGLEVGADDYLTKPFSIREFIARVKAIFRRVEVIKNESNGDSDILVGELSIEVSKRKVMLNGERVELTPKEYDLLYLLASNPGKSFSRLQLLDLLWGYQYNGYEHTVNSHINRLRGKIETNISDPKYILTTWGVGYRFNEDLI